MINDIKAKLPLKKKAEDEEIDDNDGDDLGQDATDPSLNMSDKTSSTDIRDIDEDEEVEEPKSLVDKLKAKFAPKKKASAKDDDDDEADAKKKPEKKKINPIVLVVVIGGMAVFLMPDEETPETAVETPAPQAPYKIKKVPKEDRPKPAETTAETPATDPAPTDAATTDTSVVDAPIESTPDPIATAPTEDPTVVDTTPVDPISDIPDTDSDPIDEPVVTDTPITPDPTILAPESVDSVDGQVATDEGSMTDKILEDLEKQVKKDQPKVVQKEYVAPPDYEYKGRGLVYNCAGKHWACVDAPSYKSCEDNFSSVTFKKKTVECYPFNVYENTRGCEAMQNRVVSSNAKTGFCKGN